MQDQRGPRKLVGILCDRSLSLRAASSREPADEEMRQVTRFNKEDSNQEEFSSESYDMDINDEVCVSISTESDSSECEDMEEIEEGQQASTEYNTLSLKNFARECDRYRISDRAGAKIANGLLKDLGIVVEGSTSKLIGPSKLRRERAKWGNELEKANKSEKLPQVFIFFCFLHISRFVRLSLLSSVR